jgi:Tfp pilus assembly protein PilO
MSNGSASNWRERMNKRLAWQLFAFVLLLILAIVLAVRTALDWAAVGGHSAQVTSSREVELRAQELQVAPLRGLNEKLAATRKALEGFYQKRVPPNYSVIAGTIDELAVRSGVHLTRVQYTQGAPGAYLTEITMDAGISGDYPQIMHFINGLERDQTFFVIRAMALTGQSGGLVNLRLRVSTWLRPNDAAASGLPPTAAQTSAPAPPNAPPQNEVQ